MGKLDYSEKTKKLHTPFDLYNRGAIYSVEEGKFYLDRLEKRFFYSRVRDGRYSLTEIIPLKRLRALEKVLGSKRSEGVGNHPEKKDSLIERIGNWFIGFSEL